MGLCVYAFILVQAGNICLGLTNGPYCMSCDRIPMPSDCNHVTKCGPHESCSVRQIISDSGHVFYDVGCSSAMQCPPKRSTLSGVESDDLPSDVITCKECCSGNFCNMQGCGATYRVLQRGPICFGCNNQASHDSCEIITICNEDQVCLLRSHVNPLNGLKRYDSGCAYQNQCIFGAANDSDTCKQCCFDDFCNNKCDNLPTSTQATSTLLQTGTQTVVVTPTTPTKVTTFGPQTKPTAHGSIVRPTLTLDEKGRLCGLLGFVFYTDIDMCIRLYDDRKTWSQARQVCWRDGGDLAIFKHLTPNELERWSSEHLVRGPYALQYFVGATDTHKEGNWTWLDGTQVDPKHFLSGEPNQAIRQVEENCASIFQRNDHTLLNDDVCDNTIPYICSIDLHALANTWVQDDNKQCRNSGFTGITSMGLCYKIYNQEKRPQHEARAMCMQEGADLLKLQSREVEQYFQDLKYDHKDSDLNRYWLGAQRSENKFYWFNGQLVGNNMQWDNGEPNNYNGQENCLDFRYASEIQNIGLNDDNCDTHYFFICEEKCPNTTYQYFRRSSLDLCFHVIYKNVTWSEAHAYCQNEHTQLLEPVSLHYMEFFKFYLSSGLNDVQFWVGAKLRSNEQKFHWLTHEHLISDELWRNNTHIMSAPNTCVTISRSSVDGSLALRTNLCTAHNAFICQNLW